MSRRFAVVAAILVAGLLAPPMARAESWEPVTESEGVQVWRRTVPGTSFVEFRGRGVVDASFKLILAVLKDHHRKTEWMDSCVENRLVRAIGPGHSIIYNRTGSPFPFISDRDVVLETGIDLVASRGLVHIDVWSTNDPDAPEVDGVVRMNKLVASWDLRMIGPQRTEVTYQVQADPGGLLPAWLVNLATKKLPLETILKLRKQTKKGGYEKDLEYVETTFDWRPFEAAAKAGALAGPGSTAREPSAAAP